MTLHLIITPQHGRLAWSIVHDYADPITKPFPAPIAIIPLSDAEAAVGGEALLAGWLRAHPEHRPKAPETPPARTVSDVEVAIAVSPPIQSNEVHVLPSDGEALGLPDGRLIQIGDGLVILSAYRWAEMLEAVRFSKGVTEL